MEHSAALQHLRQHSFVVWKTKGEEDAGTITRAFACMHRFFEENTPQHKQVAPFPLLCTPRLAHKANAPLHCQTCASVVQGRSFGYAATRAKESFTVRRPVLSFLQTVTLPSHRYTANSIASVDPSVQPDGLSTPVRHRPHRHCVWFNSLRLM